MCLLSQKGTFKKECFFLKNKQSQDNKKNKSTEVTNGDSNSMIFFFYAFAASYESLSHVTILNKEDRILNYGCSFHMTPHKEWFNTYKNWVGGLVFLGNNHTCKIGRDRLSLFKNETWFCKIPTNC